MVFSNTITETTDDSTDNEVYNPSASTGLVVGMTLCNTTGDTATVNIKVDGKLIMNSSISANATERDIIDSVNKLVIVKDKTLTVNTNKVLDVIVSHME